MYIDKLISKLIDLGLALGILNPKIIDSLNNVVKLRKYCCHVKQRGDRNVIDWQSAKNRCCCNRLGLSKTNSYNCNDNHNCKIFKTITHLCFIFL
jgi:hypothetical protein